MIHSPRSFFRIFQPSSMNLFHSVPFTQGTVSIMSFKQIYFWRITEGAPTSLSSPSSPSMMYLNVSSLRSSFSPHQLLTHPSHIFVKNLFLQTPHHESSTQSTVKTTSVPLLYRKTMKNKSCEQQTDQYAVLRIFFDLSRQPFF